MYNIIPVAAAYYIAEDSTDVLLYIYTYYTEAIYTSAARAGRDWRRHRKSHDRAGRDF